MTTATTRLQRLFSQGSIFVFAMTLTEPSPPQNSEAHRVGISAGRCLVQPSQPWYMINGSS